MRKTLHLKYRQIFKTTEFILKERKIRYQTRIFSIKEISSPSKWWYQLVWHGMGQPNHVLLMDVEWKWMHRHTSSIYRENFHLSFNAFINIKTIFIQDNAPSYCSNLVQDFLQETLNSRFIKVHECPPHHLIAIPSIIIFEIKWKKKYMKID